MLFGGDHNTLVIESGGDGSHKISSDDELLFDSSGDDLLIVSGGNESPMDSGDNLSLLESIYSTQKLPKTHSWQIFIIFSIKQHVSFANVQKLLIIDTLHHKISSTTAQY